MSTQTNPDSVFNFDTLFAEYEHTEETYPIHLPGMDKTIEFKYLKSSVEITALQKSASAWAKEYAKKDFSKIPNPKIAETLGKYHTDDSVTLMQVYILNACCVDPNFQGHDKWLRLALTCGPIFNAIIVQYDAANTNQLQELRVKAIDEGKGP